MSGCSICGEKGWEGRTEEEVREMFNRLFDIGYHIFKIKELIKNE